MFGWKLKIGRRNGLKSKKVGFEKNKQPASACVCVYIYIYYR